MRLTIAQTVVYTKNVSHSPSRRQTPKESALRLSQDPQVRTLCGTQLEQPILLRNYGSVRFPFTSHSTTNTNVQQIFDCMCMSVCVITQMQKISHPDQIILSPFSRISDIQGMQQNPKSSIIQEARDAKTSISQFRPWRTPLMPPPNCVTVTTLPYGCSATQWPGELGVHSLSVGNSNFFSLALQSFPKGDRSGCCT